MNKKSLYVLEYDKIMQRLAEYTVTEMGHALVKKLKPRTEFIQIQTELDKTKDGADILRLKGGIPVPNIVSVAPHLKRLAIGATLNGQELAQIGKVLRFANESQIGIAHV